MVLSSSANFSTRTAALADIKQLATLMTLAKMARSDSGHFGDNISKDGTIYTVLTAYRVASTSGNDYISTEIQICCT